VKPGIIVMSELYGDVGARILEVQRRFDPRVASELPPHVTITGSSGMGPISPDTTDEDMIEALESVARSSAPFEVTLQPPMQFMQSTVVVLPIDPNGPIRALHERIKGSGLSFERPRFTFTPHVTLSFYPELSRDALRELLRFRVSESVRIDRIQAYRALDVTRSVRIADLPLAPAA
jgi:2'-5' RNA ligase